MAVRGNDRGQGIARVLLLYQCHASPSAGRAQKFPRDASFKIWLSTVRSATALRRRAFSPFHIPQSLRLVHFQSALLPAPTIKRVIRHSNAPAGLSQCLPLCKDHLCFPKFAYDLLYTTLFPWHLVPLSRPVSHINWTIPWGSGHGKLHVL